MSESKRDINKSRMILEAIDALRNRKARPDESRICHWIERRYGLTRDEVITDIKEAIAAGKVLKVRYKDSISYRNPAKFNRVALNQGNKPGLPVNVTKRVLRVLRQLSLIKSTPNETRGSTMAAILNALHSSKQLLSYNETSLERILKRAIQSGSVSRLNNGNYVLSSIKNTMNVPKKRQSSSTPVTSASNSNDSVCIDFPPSIDPEATKTVNRKKVVPQLQLKRVRPMSTRRKFKKSLGPDFLEPSDLGLQYLQDTFEPKCDYCQLTAVSNREGDDEELLVCKDCRTKAHPSCLNYSKELATRSRCSPWQCMDCKACFVCEDSGDGENMLFCDLCDKGYHMGCHDPPITKKPNGEIVSCCGLVSKSNGRLGKWVCNLCQENKSPRDVKEELSESVFDFGIDHKMQNELDHSDAIFDKICKLNYTDNALPSDLLEMFPNIAARPKSWSVDDVETFIKFIGFPEQAVAFKEQMVDGMSLLLLSRMDVLRGLQLKLGPALKIYGHVRRLQFLSSQQE